LGILFLGNKVSKVVAFFSRHFFYFPKDPTLCPIYNVPGFLTYGQEPCGFFEKYA
jgi:hypothetical protein